jgi:Zn-dependent protease with chaperone function
VKKSILGVSLITTTTCLYGLLAAVVILVTLIAGGEVLNAIYASIIVLIIQFLISPALTDLSMRLFYKVKFNQDVPEFAKKYIEELCQKYDVKMPKLGIIEDGGPNAFTYGRTKKSARIILTRGMFNLLNEEEIKTVIAHEMGHIVHYDMLFMTAVQIVPLVLYAIYEMLTSSAKNDRDDDSGKTAVIGYIAYLLYIVCQYIILYLSRTREYYADEFSIEETKNPNSLAEALVKIGFGLSTEAINSKSLNRSNTLGISDAKTSKAMAISCIDDTGKVSKEKIKNAMKWEMWNPWAKWYEINSTHPLISKRLIAITSKCQNYNQEPYIVFDLQKTESYVDDFLLEVLINFCPVIALVIGLVIISLNEGNKMSLGITLLLLTLTLYIKYKRAHKTIKVDNKTTISNLLSEVKVSHITSIPCVLEGNIIGRGNPGCIFNEDFTLKDSTGIIFLDYNQPINVINKIFALFRSKEYFDKNVIVKGWYRRSPVPYIEILEMTVDGKTKKVYTNGFTKVLLILMLIASIILMFL